METIILMERGPQILAAALTALGVWMAAAARPALKRAVGVGVAHAGPMALLAAGPPSSADLAAATGLVACAYVVFGAALAVRLNEVYRTQEADELDAADDAAEGEPSTGHGSGFSAPINARSHPGMDPGTDARIEPQSEPQSDPRNVHKNQQGGGRRSEPRIDPFKDPEPGRGAGFGAGR